VAVETATITLNKKQAQKQQLNVARE